jgi:hypothetical protein
MKKLLLLFMVLFIVPIVGADSLILNPDSNGNLNEWTASAGDNYDTVNEDAPPNDGDYVSVGAKDDFDYWNLESHGGTTGTINNVTVVLRTWHSAGNEEYAFCYDVGGTDACSADYGDHAAATTANHTFITDPGGGGWDWNDIEDLEIGIKSRAVGGWGGTAYCSWGYAVVNYEPPPDDTCTPPVSGQWNVSCSDNCIWDEVGGYEVPGNMNITGSGSLALSVTMNFTGSGQYIWFDDASGCELNITSGGEIVGG